MTRTFHRNFLSFIPQPQKFAMQEIAQQAFIPSDGLNIYELARQPNKIHGKENTAPGNCLEYVG